MRHLNHRHTLGVKKEHREALVANLAASLIKHGRIKTTVAKAKALRPFIERNITLAKKAEGSSPETAVHYRRLALSRIRDKDAVTQLFNERVKEFTDRTGGYTRILKLGARRGDAAEMALIEFIAASDEGYTKRKTKKGAAKVEESKKEEAPVAVEEKPETEASAAEASAEQTPAETEEKKD